MDLDKPRLPWFGVILIIFGSILLLDKLDVLNIRFLQVLWPLVMLFGIAKVASGFSRNTPGRIFWGTLVFLYGLYFFLHSIESIDMRPRMFFPATFLILGICFIMMYVNNFKDWYMLIPAFLFCAIGVAFIMTEVGWLYRWEVWQAVRLYWPVALILIGLAIILRRKASVTSNQMSSPTS